MTGLVDLVRRIAQAAAPAGECEFYAADLELAGAIKQILLDGGVPAYLERREAPLWRIAAPASCSLFARTLLERRLGRVIVRQLEHTLLFASAPPRPPALELRTTDAAGLEALAAIARGPVAQDRRDAAEALRRAGTAGVETLYALLVECCHEDRVEAGWELAAAAGRAEVAPARCYLDLLRDPDVPTRARAARFLSRIGSPEAVPALVGLLRDADTEVRAEAADALWELTGEAFDFEPGAAVEAREEAVRRWEAWLDKWA